MQLKIDPSLRTPLHHQFRCGILSVIQSGGFKPGDFLFTELELCRKHGVSLSPVRQAVNHLAVQGIIESRRAKGVFFIREVMANEERIL
jgi:GntR family transcriptional regulator